MGDLFGMLGNIGTGLVNNIFGRVFADYDRQQNYRYGQMQANAADRRTRALYADLYSPEALKQQYQKAGLSPSLMFGGTPGQGGAQGAMGSNTGPQTPYMPISLLEGAQIAKIQAETKNIEQDTENKGKEGENIEADTALKWQQANYQKVAAALTEEQTKGQQWQNYITSETSRFTINQAASMAEEAAYAAMQASFEIIIAQNAAEVSTETKQAQIDQAIANVKYTEVQTLLAAAGIEKTEAEITRINAEITKWRQEVAQGWKNLEIQTYNAGTQRAMWKTQDEYMMHQVSILRDRLSFDKDLGERQFTWTIMNDTFNSITGAFNKAANVPQAPVHNHTHTHNSTTTIVNKGR